jgi:hypothetical protein
MRVKELIQHLQKFDPEARVIVVSEERGCRDPAPEETDLKSKDDWVGTAHPKETRDPYISYAKGVIL